MPLDLRDITWTCMVCGQERPDRAISVAYRPVKGLEARFPATHFNVRYCNDNPRCAATAHETGPWLGMSRDEAS